MTKALVVVLIAFFPLGVYAEGLPGVLRAAEGVNDTFRSLVIDAELAELRYQKSRIEAQDEVARLSAEATYSAALGDERRAYQTYYTDVVNAVYGAVIADYERRIAERNAAVARDQVAAVEVRFRSGLVPEGDVIDARISLRSAEVEREEKTWAWLDANETLDTATGLRFESITLPGVPSFLFRITLEHWIEADYAVARARITEQIAELRLARLPANAARFDRLTLEAELDRARLARQRAVTASERAFESLRRRVTTFGEVLTIRSEQLVLSQASYREAQERFSRGLLTAVQRDQTQIRVLTAERNLVEAQRNYIRTILEYAAATGAAPEDVL
ncbi:MAG: TolC family protein [Spirochaetaceae bacterium]|nr:MAG: TolC family protein [Spirochaetaceae bacterium]